VDVDATVLVDVTADVDGATVVVGLDVAEGSVDDDPAVVEVTAEATVDPTVEVVAPPDGLELHPATTVTATSAAATWVVGRRRRCGR
jgi:hypothetical protein